MKELESLIKKLNLPKINQDDLTRDMFAMYACYLFTVDPEGERPALADLNNGGWTNLAAACYGFANAMMKARAIK